VLAVLLLRLCGGESDGEDLRLAVGHTGNAGFQHGNRVQSGDLLGDEDALPEGAVGELEARDNVAAGVDVADSGVEPFVGQHESGSIGMPCSSKPKPSVTGPRPTATRRYSASRVEPSSRVTF